MSKAVLGPAATQRYRSRGPVAARLVVDQWLLERPPAPDLESYLVCTWQGDLGAMCLPVPDECLDLVWVDDGSVWLAGPETRSWPRGYPLSASLHPRCATPAYASMSTHYYLDMTPLGRQEDWEEPKDRSSARHPAAGQA